MPEPLPFGRWLKHLRAALDLTQEALAQAVGCAPQTIRTFESGTRRPSRELAERLAIILAVPAEQRSDFLRAARTVAHASFTHGDVAEQLRAGTVGVGSTQSARTKGTHHDQGPPVHAPILSTKLYMPRPRAQIVSRPRLLARLEEGRAGLLTVIAAPAGFGKTTLLTDWFTSHEPHNLNVAWLSLDANDSDLVQFLRYLIAALQTLAPTVGGSAAALLASAYERPLDTVLPLLVNDLTQLPEHTVLVLDDYHVVEAPAVHQALAFLLDHLPPQLHFVIATRVDPPLPLARLRARGQLTELRVQELGFTLQEAEVFLTNTMGLSLTPTGVAALEMRTEGWIAGLQLAALSLQDRPGGQQAQFIEAFTGSHRFVVDYLVDEVLTHLPHHLQTFLLQTSILERLCGPLCDAVMLGDTTEVSRTEHLNEQAYSHLVLEQLERSNLFLVPLDEDRHWYRYHHLFAQVLRARLVSGASREAVLLLNGRAVTWLEQKGLLDEAVQQACAEGDHERTAELIERHGMPLVERSEHVRVRSWLDRLPSALIETRPRLRIVAGWMLAALSRFEALDQLLAAGMHTFGAEDLPRDVRGELAVLRAIAARFQQQHARALAFAHEALTLLPAEVHANRAKALITVGVCLMEQGDMAGAEAALVEAGMLAQAAANAGVQLAACYWLGVLYDRQARLDDTLRTFQLAISMLGQMYGASLPNVGAAHIGLGEVWYERNNLDRAQASIAEGLRLLSASIEHFIVGMGYINLARIHQARGNADAALAVFEEGEAWATRLHLDSRQFRGLLAAYRTRIWLRQGNLYSAFEWAASCGLDDELHLSDVRRLTLIRVRLAQYRERPDKAALDDLSSVVARLRAMAEEQGWARLHIELVMLQALVSQAAGDIGCARTLLASALARAASEGFTRLFVDEGMPMAALLASALSTRGWGDVERRHSYDIQGYARRLLSTLQAEGIAAPQAAPAPFSLPSPGIEPLTERELEVLRLLAQGRSNQAIADELTVAVGTVKRHVNSILGKLQVESRLQAVAHARDRGLV